MKLFHLACILVYLMNIKQIIPQIATTNDTSVVASTTSGGFVEACCSTTSTKTVATINTSIDIPINPFRFLFSKGSSLYILNQGLLILVTIATLDAI